MKKRYVSIIALFVALGAGKADAAQYTVSDYSDSGTGTLRSAITGANGTNGADRITFSQAGTITLLSPLPLINKGDVTFKTDYPVSIENSSAAGSYVLGTGNTNPHLVIPENLSLVASGTGNVTALYGVDQVNIDGTLGGNISATATNADYAYGAHASNTLTIYNNLIGEISATANGGQYAYGLFAENDLTIGGNLTAEASVSAVATYNLAVGIGSNFGNLALIGNLSGTVSAKSTSGSIVYGMGAVQDLTIGGSLFTGGSVTATAGGNNAGAIYSYLGNITIGDPLNGTGSLAGAVSATATGSHAYGLQAGLGSIAIGSNLSGDISATATNGHASYGMYAGKDITIGGNLTAAGSVNANAGGSDAYGIAANSGNLAVRGGNLAGEVSAEAGLTRAAGLYAGGGIYGADSVTPLTVSGTVTATANGAAAAILAIGAMNLDITGTVSGTDTGGSALGYAIHSGDFDYIGSGFVASAAVADQVTVRGSGGLVGNVDLGAGDDSMAIKGLSDISMVSTLSGGDGGGDDLVFQGWSGTLVEKVIDWESVQVAGDSEVDLGVDKEITPSTGSSLHMTIGPSAVVYARGSSPGTYRIGGRLLNNGTLDMLDNQVNDRVTVTGNYNGTGTLLLDADLGASGVQDPAEQLVIKGNAGNNSGPTTVYINNVVNAVALTEGDGIRIIEVDGTSSENAFVLGNPDDFGPFAVDLVNNDGSNWDVISPGYREEAALLQAVTPFIEKSGRESVPRFSERRSYTGLSGINSEKRGFWVRTSGSKYRLGLSGDASTEIKSYSGVTQVGSDLSAGGSEKLRYHVGLYGGIGCQNGDVDGLRSGQAGELNDTAYSIGYYATLYAPEKYYIEGVLQTSFHDLSLDYLTDPEQNVNFRSYLASVESGFSVPLSSSFSLQPQLQMIYQHTDGFDLSTRIGEVNIADHDGLQGRLGITGMVNSSLYAFNSFFEVNLIKDFSKENRVSYAADSITLESKPETLFLGGALGISRKVSEKSSFSGYLKAEALYGLDSHGSLDCRLTAGIRRTW